MTLQLGFGPGTVDGIQLGINEFASALLVGERFGSIFTRSENAQLFENLAAGAKVSIQELPPWLHRVQFARTTLMHGENMRPITDIRTMNSIQTKTLEGLATFVTLCCQWTHTPHATAARFIRELITGDLGPIVDPGYLRKSPKSIIKKLEMLIDRFIRATIDSDAGSPQSVEVQKSLAQLSVKAGRVSFNPFRSDRLIASDKQLLACMLGSKPEASPDQESSGHGAYDLSLGRPLHKDSRVHDTVSITSASIAIAAAANNADVYVECHTEDSVFYLPKKPLNGLSNGLTPLFLVRLWLCQPPSHVSNMIDVYNQHFTKPGELESEQEEAPMSMSYPTIYGGHLELSIAAANILGFDPQYTVIEREKAISQLWQQAFDYGFTLRLQRSSEHWQAYLHLEHSSGDNFDLSDKAVRLAKLLANHGSRREKWLQKTPNQSKLLLAATEIIDDLYSLENYDRETLTRELLAGSALIKLAMTVGALHQMTHSDGTELSAYAISSEILQEGNTILWDFLTNAMGRGVGTMCLILATGALWTGTTSEAAWPISQQNQVRVSQNSIYESSADHTVLGKVGPHGVVVLEIVRNPVQFALFGLSKPVVFFTRGSIPLLGRDTRDGYILTSRQRITRSKDGVQLQSRAAESADSNAIKYSDPVITVEPDTSDELRSTIICAWYGGDLAFEIDPLMAMLNVSKPVNNLGKPLLPKMRMFKETTSDLETGPHEFPTQEPKRYPPQLLDPLDFLKKKAIVVKGGSAVFRACSPVWLLCASGLVSTHCVSVSKSKLNYTDVLLDEGEVIIEYSEDI